MSAAVDSRVLYGTQIIGTGAAFPERILTNQDLVEQLARDGVETNDEWILKRTGIKERRISDPNNPDERNSSLAARAAIQALEMAGLKPTEIDFIILGTSSPDQLVPSTACLVQAKIGATQAWACDLTAACAGFTYALAMADAFIRSGQAKRGLVIGSEVMSSITNWKDRGSCILFGDAAGAIVVQQTDAQNPRRVLHSKLWADGRHGALLEIPYGETKVTMQGREVFKYAVKVMCDLAVEVAEEAGFQLKDIDWLVAHQANMRIIDSMAERLEFPIEKMLLNIERFGNSSAATIPTLLDEGIRSSRVKKGQLLMLDGFGAGFTAAANLVRF